MDHQPLVSIVIPNYNGKNDLRNCLSSLRNLAYCAKEVIVVDSGSTDGSSLMVSQEFPEVRLIKTGKMGVGEANNIGMQSAKGDLIMFDLNSDDLVDRNWLTNLVKSFSLSHKVGIVCGKRLLWNTDKIIDSAGAKIHFLTGTVPAIGRGKKDSGQFDMVKEVDYVPVPLVKRVVLEEVGSCDPEYYLYYEEPDFCLRARRAGYTILYVPSAVFWHRRSATVGAMNPRKHYYERRNRVRFIIKNFPSSTLVIPLMLHMILLSALYSFFFLVKSDFRYFQAEKHALTWNIRNLRKTLGARSLVNTNLALMEPKRLG